VDILGYPVPINVDVPEDVCLPIPAEYRFPQYGDLKKDMDEAIIALLRGRHTYIYGLPGSGKDAFIHALSAMSRRPTIFKTVTPTTDVEAWLYVRSFDKDGTHWEEQELFKALTQGYTCPMTGRKVPYLVLITDFDRATKSQAEILRIIIDSIMGRVQGPGGKVYKLFPGTQIVATANTSGGGDTRGRMVSSNVIDGSIMDRFERKIEFHWMDWKDEGEIAKAKFPLLFQRCPDAFTQVGNATGVLRDAIAKDKLFAEFSHRAVCAWFGHMEDIIALTGKVPKDLVKRSARVWLDGMPDEEARLEAERLCDPHIKGGVVGTEADRSGNQSDPLAGFGRK
jgi:MoxR-like ATPase